jgi:hypothetical protein
VIALAVDDPEKVAVKMHRVVHHGAVDHNKAYDFTLADKDRVAC